MKLQSAKITFLVGRDSTTIELIDDISGTTFAEITLTPEQLSSALSRLAYTPCEIEVHGLDRIGKKMEMAPHVFEIPNLGYGQRENSKDLIHQLAVETSPKGWEPDKYYGSQNSFFQKDGKQFARTTIRRWVELPNPDECDATKAK